MSKTTSIFARVEPEIKEQAEMVLSKLGISMSNAINIFLRQVVLQNGLPYPTSSVFVPNRRSLPIFLLGGFKRISTLNTINTLQKRLSTSYEIGASER